MVRDIARARGLRFRLASIEAEVSKESVANWLEEGRISSYGNGPALTAADVASSVRIVAQMGVEPFIAALDQGADVVIAGRACDTAVFSAFPIRAGADQGLAMHAGKLIECASQCAVPSGRDAIMAYLREDSFVIESMNPLRRCTPLSVAAHSLYEQLDPNVALEPGGSLELMDASYESVDGRRTRVRGSRWVPASNYTLKLEGAARVGHRAFSLGGIADPALIQDLPVVAARVRDTVTSVFAAHIDPSQFSVQFRMFGTREPGEPRVEGGNVEMQGFVIIDVVGATAEIAQAVCGAAKQYLLHADYAGNMGSAGNLAIPFPPDVLDGGEVFRFSVYHILAADDGLSLFPISIQDIG
jgi:hypothetical protein